LVKYRYYITIVPPRIQQSINYDSGAKLASGLTVSTALPKIIENYFHLDIRMKLTANKIAGLLRQHGYKLTPQRWAVLNVISHRHDHLTPAAIHDRVSQEHPGIGLVTIYRTLEVLAELGLLCKVHVEGGCRSYLMRRPSVHHHHLICSGCGRVVDFTDCALNELEQRLSRETGFEMKDHLLELYGHCQNCQKIA